MKADTPRASEIERRTIERLETAPGRIKRRRFSPRRAKKISRVSRASKITVQNFFSKARTYKFQYKSTEQPNLQFICGLPTIYQQNEKRSLFGVANQGRVAFLFLHLFGCNTVVCRRSL